MDKKIFATLIFFIFGSLFLVCHNFNYNREITIYDICLLGSSIIFPGIYLKLMEENRDLKYLITLLQSEVKRYKTNLDLNKDNLMLKRQRERFIATLNHDLKTPAIAQVRSLDLILNGNFGKLMTEQYNMIKLTKESCQNMLDIIVTVLDNYKFENNQIHLCEHNIDLIELIENCCVELKDIFASKSLSVKIFPSNNLYKIPGDVILLGRAVRNIIENSVSYAYENSDFIIKIHNIGMNTCISIVNEGIPLPEDTINRLFDPYECNSSMYNKIGFGIKLYLAQQIIQAHNGGIIAKNELSGGTVFDIILPVSATKHSVINFTESGMFAENISA